MFNRDLSFKKKLISLTIVTFIFFLGYNITLPFIDTELVGFYSDRTFGLFGLPLVNTTSVFALGIIPFITAGIVFSLLNMVIPKLKTLNTGTELDRAKIRVATVIVGSLVACSQFFLLKNYWTSLDGLYLATSFSDNLTVFVLVFSGFFVLILLSSLVSKLGLIQGSSFILLLTLMIGFNHSISFLTTMQDKIAVFLISLTLLFIISFALLSFVKIDIITTTSSNNQASLPLFLKLFSTGIAPLIFASAVTGLIYLVYPDIVNQSILYYFVILTITLVLSFIWAKNTYDPLNIVNTLNRNSLTVKNALPGLPSAVVVNNAVNFTAITSALIVGYSFIIFPLIASEFVQGVSVALFIMLSIDFISKIKTAVKS
jgi:preprotein translocase subunit SecY